MVSPGKKKRAHRLRFPARLLVHRWTAFAENVTAAANDVLGTRVPLQGAAFARSSHKPTAGFSPQAIFQNGILSSPAGSQIKLCVPDLLESQNCSSSCRRISQHHYSGSFCTGTLGVLQDLMSKSSIRSNLTAFAPDIAAVQQRGLTYVLGETNSFACHGAPGVSNTAGAALWGLDYALFAGQLGITRAYFHQGIGFKYSFVRRRHRSLSPDLFLSF